MPNNKLYFCLVATSGHRDDGFGGNFPTGLKRIAPKEQGLDYWLLYLLMIGKARVLGA